MKFPTIRTCIMFLGPCSLILIFCLLGSQCIPATPDPIFKDITTQVGLDAVSAFRVSIADVNGDGYPDLLFHTRDQAPNNQSLYLNVPNDDTADPNDRKFIDFTAESGIRATREGEPDGRQSSLAIFGDVDNDGDLDMFSGVHSHRMENYQDNGSRNALMLNDGQGHFSHSPDTTLHDEGLVNTSSAVFLDYDLDGKLDLYTGNWWENWDESISFPDNLYRGLGNGRFVKVTEEAGLYRENPTYAVSTADWNSDGYPDLFVGNYCRGPSLHFRNNKDGTFTEIGAESGYSDYTLCSWGAIPRDFDNDHDIDFINVMVHGYEGPKQLRTALLVNQGPSENYHLIWDVDDVVRDEPKPRHHGDHHAIWFDIDGDGLTDLAITECGYNDPDERLYILKQNAEHVLVDYTEELGLLDIKAPNPVNALDYDLDGDEDLIVGLNTSTDPLDQLRFFENTRANQKSWLTLTLQGQGGPDHSNVSAIGAKVELQAGGVTYTREVSAGPGHFGPQSPLDLTFGLNEATKIESIKVFWPNRLHTSQELRDVGVNQFLTIVEGE